MFKSSKNEWSNIVKCENVRKKARIQKTNVNKP